MIILIVLVVFFFGGEKISELARGLGRFTGEFKKGREEMEREIKKAEIQNGMLRQLGVRRRERICDVFIFARYLFAKS